MSHALEGQRHDFFIELAQKGDIDVVFFGRTTTEMWWWPARGKGVWDRELRLAEGRELRVAGNTPRQPRVADAERRAGRLSGEARSP